MSLFIEGQEKGKIGRSYDSKNKKIVCAVELTKEGKVKSMYSIRIENYSVQELRKIFEKHISKEATVATDKGKGYRP